MRQLHQGATTRGRGGAKSAQKSAEATADDAVATDPIVCAYGTPWPCGPCRHCEAANDQDVADHARDVFFGLYDAEGFTPNERAAMTRKPADELVRALASLGKRRNKWGNVKTLAYGFMFDSKREAAAYGDLRVRQLAGEIQELQRQISYDLVVNGVLICRYRADFVYVEGGRSVIADAKGKATDVYRLKKKLMLAIHAIDIVEL